MKRSTHPPLLGLAVAALIAGAAPASAQQVDCPPACGIGISVPANPTLPPAVDPDILAVEAGSTIVFRTDSPVRIRFEGETPFVNPAGRPIMNFVVNRGNRSMTTSPDRDVCAGNGCKYTIFGQDDRNRPPRDPFIVVR